MKIAFISDIHGNYEALKSVLSKIDYEGVDKIFCLGDVVGYYSQVNECCEEIKRRNIPCVMGNHDWAFLEALQENRPMYKEAQRKQLHNKGTIKSNTHK